MTSINGISAAALSPSNSTRQPKAAIEPDGGSDGGRDAVQKAAVESDGGNDGGRDAARARAVGHIDETL